ncbi:MAG: cytochrome c biogenesis protein CcdA [Bacteroidales bacterium]|jgi:thiol:disulfide interchange protein DsbD|nr:cytochrome c biogenesis protein CcdA [Bacteroidales bacterium]
MKKLSLFILTALLTVLSYSINAQVNPVSWEFKTVKINDSIAELQFIAKIENKWHMYAQQHQGMEIPLSFEFKNSSDFKLIGKVAEPKPIVSYDPVFGDTSKYYTKSVTLKQRILVKNNKPFELKGELSGQACIDGKCVAIDRKFSFQVKGFENITPSTIVEEPVVEVSSQTIPTETLQTTPAPVVEPEEEEDQSMLTFFFLAFLGGLAGLLMPCVFPMIPMTISYFLKMKEKAKFYAVVFGLSIVVIFIIIGIGLSLIFGPDFANILSTHWIPNLLFALIFIIFAISLFGYFEIALPSSWINKSAKMESSGGIIGVFFMALTLVLVSFSCTLPIAGAVALGSADGSFLKPIIGMLGFSLGIAVPFTLFAFFPGMLKTLPKSGGWMNTLKVVLAFVELAFALKFINVPDQTYHWGILDREVYLAAWIVIFSMMGFYLLGKIRFPHDDEMPVQKSWIRLFFTIITFTFVVYLIPGMWGAPLKAISGWLPPVTTQDFDVNKIVQEELQTVSFTGTATPETKMTETPKYADKMHLPYGIKGYFDYHQALKVAKIENKPVFVDFTGHGCVNCRNVESAVWKDPRVKKMFAEELIVTALYVDDKVVDLLPEDQIKDADGEMITKLGKKNMFIQNTIYKQASQPCYFILDTDGSVLVGPLEYELNPDKYLQFLESGVQAFKKKHAK